MSSSCCTQYCNDLGFPQIASNNIALFRKLFACIAQHIRGGDNITITVEGDTIIISGGGGFTNVVCVGTGACIISSNVIPLLELKTFVAGPGINITETATEITIESTGSVVTTATPITGDGTLGNPVRLIDGSGCNDMLQWSPLALAWQILQPPSATVATVGTAGAIYPSVSAAFANGCNFVRIVTDVTEAGITIPGAGNYLIYIDPGVTYALNTTSTVFTGSSLTIHGAGPNSILSWTAPVINTPMFLSANSADSLYVSNIQFQNLSNVDGALFVNPTPILFMENTLVVLPNAAFGFVGDTTVAVLTNTQLQNVRLIGGGAASQLALNAGPGSIVQVNALTLSGTFFASGNVVTLVGTDVIVSNISVVSGTTPIVLALDGSVNNVVAPNATLILPGTVGSNFYAQNITIRGLNLVSNILALNTLTLDACGQSAITDVQCAFLDTTTVGGSAFNVSNLQILAGFVPANTINLGIETHWNNVEIFPAGIITLGVFGNGRCACSNWNFPNMGTINVEPSTNNMTFENFLVPGVGVGGATCTLAGIQNRFFNWTEFLSATLSTTTSGTAQGFRGINFTLDAPNATVNNIILTSVFAINATASASSVENIICNTITTPVLGSGLTNLRVVNVRQISAGATITISADTRHVWSVLEFRGSVIFDLYNASISNVTCSSSVRFITTRSNDGRGSVVSNLVHFEDGLPTTALEIGFPAGAQQCVDVSFTDVVSRVGFVSINFVSNCSFDNVSQLGSAGSLSIATALNGPFTGTINSQLCQFRGIQSNGTTAIGSAAVGASAGGRIVSCVFDNFICGGNVPITNADRCQFTDFWVERLEVLSPVTAPTATPRCNLLQFTSWYINTPGVAPTSTIDGDNLTFTDIVSRIRITPIDGTQHTWNGYLQQQTGAGTGTITVNATNSTFSDWNIHTEPLTCAGDNQTWTNIKVYSALTISGNQQSWTGGTAIGISAPVVWSGNFGSMAGFVYNNTATDFVISGDYNTFSTVKVAVNSRNINVTGSNNALTGCHVGINLAGTGTINGAAPVGFEPLAVGNFVDSALTGVFNASSIGNAVF